MVAPPLLVRAVVDEARAEGPTAARAASLRGSALTQWLLQEAGVIQWVAQVLAPELLDPLLALPSPFNLASGTVAFLRQFAQLAPPRALRWCAWQLHHQATPTALLPFLLLRFVCPVLLSYATFAPVEAADLLRLTQIARTLQAMEKEDPGTVLAPVLDPYISGDLLVDPLGRAFADLDALPPPPQALGAEADMETVVVCVRLIVNFAPSEVALTQAAIACLDAVRGAAAAAKCADSCRTLARHANNLGRCAALLEKACPARSPAAKKALSALRTHTAQVAESMVGVYDAPLTSMDDLSRAVNAAVVSALSSFVQELPALLEALANGAAREKWLWQTLSASAAEKAPGVERATFRGSGDRALADDVDDPVEGVVQLVALFGELAEVLRGADDALLAAVDAVLSGQLLTRDVVSHCVGMLEAHFCQLSLLEAKLGGAYRKVHAHGLCVWGRRLLVSGPLSTPERRDVTGFLFSDGLLLVGAPVFAPVSAAPSRTPKRKASLVVEEMTQVGLQPLHCSFASDRELELLPDGFVIASQVRLAFRVAGQDTFNGSRFFFFCSTSGASQNGPSGCTGQGGPAPAR